MAGSRKAFKVESPDSDVQIIGHIRQALRKPKEFYRSNNLLILCLEFGSQVPDTKHDSSSTMNGHTPNSGIYGWLIWRWWKEFVTDSFFVAHFLQNSSRRWASFAFNINFPPDYNFNRQLSKSCGWFSLCRVYEERPVLQASYEGMHDTSACFSLDWCTIFKLHRSRCFRRYSGGVYGHAWSDNSLARDAHCTVWLICYLWFLFIPL